MSQVTSVSAVVSVVAPITISAPVVVPVALYSGSRNHIGGRDVSQVTSVFAVVVPVLPSSAEAFRPDWLPLINMTDAAAQHSALTETA